MRRLKNLLPFLLIALPAQIFPPISAPGPASLAASDPLAGAVICHGNAAPGAGQTDQTGHRAHDGCCSVCSVLQTGAPVDVPLIAAIDVDRVAEQVAWLDFAFRLTNARAGSHAQARAPPAIS